MHSVICFFFELHIGGMKPFDFHMGKLSPQLLRTFQNLTPKQMWQNCPLQASYFTSNFPVKSPEPILSSVQPPLWPQPVLKGRQQVRSAGNISAPVATTPCSFSQAHDPASCVGGGISGRSAYQPSAAAGLHFSSLGTGVVPIWPH